VAGAAAVSAALAAAIAAMGDTLSPHEAAAAVIEMQRRATETVDLDARLRAIEERIRSNEPND
jgi:Mrp family chromosome partitioning ATPase